MAHINEDNLVKLALNLTEEELEKNLGSHLSHCELCQNKLREIQNDIEAIGSLQFDFEDKSYPLPSLPPKNRGLLWKIAAALIIGFLSGYLTSELSRPYYINIVPQRLDKTLIQPHSLQPVNCLEIDIGH
jgi:hypothetical protein